MGKNNLDKKIKNIFIKKKKFDLPIINLGAGSYYIGSRKL